MERLTSEIKRELSRFGAQGAMPERRRPDGRGECVAGPHRP